LGYFFSGKNYVPIFRKNGKGYILDDLSRTRLVTLLRHGQAGSGESQRLGVMETVWRQHQTKTFQRCEKNIAILCENSPLNLYAKTAHRNLMQK
jgi:hypothetical protein